VKYVALTSGRNEEKYIEQTLNAVMQLNPPPEVYVVVDDGSNDKTYEIISNKKEIHLIKLVNPRHPVRGVNLAWALNAGIEKVMKLIPDWDFLLKVDADSVIPQDYFSRLFLEFEKNPRLGISSGTPYDERVWKGRASDGAKIYRRQCWNDIGSFTPCNAFDTLALIEAKRHNWVVGSFPDLKYTQLRTWRRENLNRWILSGRSRYYLGFPVWHTFLISIVYSTDSPWILGSLSMFLAHLLTSFGMPRKPFSKAYYGFASKYAIWETLERYHEKSLH
jgi:glycosyltransferase involved in cell wall biosynthesis